MIAYGWIVLLIMVVIARPSARWRLDPEEITNWKPPEVRE